MIFQNIFLQISDSEPVQIIQSFDVTTQILLIIAAFTAVGVSTYGVILSNRRTKESNELLRKDLDTKLRPWIKIETVRPKFVSMNTGALVPWDKYLANQSKYEDKVKNVHFWIPYTNFGAIPATKIKAWSTTRSEKITKEIMLKEKPDRDFVQLMPEETKQFIHEITYEEYDLLSKEKPLIVGAAIEYNINEEHSVTIGKIWELERTGSEIIDEW